VTSSIAKFVRIARLGEVDERNDRRTYWLSRPIEERIREVEVLRRMWPELVGDPDQPIARVVFKRALR
jgi:hypothetical protein